MTHPLASSLTSKLLWCSGVLLVTSPLWLAHVGAQPPVDPFGDGEAQPAAADPKKGTGEAAKLLQPESAVILQLRESDPKTADQLIRAASAVLDFGRPDECKRYLEKFVAGKFPEADLVDLPGKYGTSFFLELAANPKLQPEGKQVSDQVLLAARKFAENPARLAELVRTLNDSNPEAVAAALTRLDQAGPALVGPMLAALADPSRAAEHPKLYAAMVELRATVEAPLVGVLAAAPEPQRIVAANVLGLIESRHAARHLLAPAHAPSTSPAFRAAARRALQKIMGAVPQQHDAEGYLFRQLTQIREGEHPFEVDADNNTVIWQWDAAKSAPASRTLALEDAIRQLCARMATDLYTIRPDHAEYQRLRLLHHLEFAKAMSGVANPLPAAATTIAKEAGPAMVAEVLAMAMNQKLHGAAIAAAEILGEIGNEQLLASDGPGVLSTALTHADRRVRLAAALAIVKLNPQRSFPGASHIVEILGEAVRTAGVNRVLVVDSRLEYGQTIAGLLADQGYYGEIAVGSKQAFRQATSGPDYEMILISDALDLPVVEMVQLFRRDRRTALIPIGVMVGVDSADNLPKLLHDDFRAPLYGYRDPIGKVRERTLESVTTSLKFDRRTLVAPRPHSSESTAFLAQQVRKLGGRELTSREERQFAGKAALAAFQTLASNPETFNRYGVLREEASLIAALNSPGLSVVAAEVLGLLATPKAQTALVDVCSQPARPLADRQAALAAFQAAINRRGIMLTQQQILLQYDRYNESETLDKPTQEILGAVLDTLESRRPQAGLLPATPTPMTP
jgi:DNA-directed RNA polymerase subunit K/omega